MKKQIFEFEKERGFGDLIQDYIFMYKNHFKHIHRLIFRSFIPFIAFFVVIAYFFMKQIKSNNLGSMYSFLDYNKFSLDRKSTRLNSSHVSISYAVFSLKQKN